MYSNVFYCHIKHCLNPFRCAWMCVKPSERKKMISWFHLYFAQLIFQQHHGDKKEKNGKYWFFCLFFVLQLFRNQLSSRPHWVRLKILQILVDWRRKQNILGALKICLAACTLPNTKICTKDQWGEYKTYKTQDQVINADSAVIFLINH